MGTPAQVDWFAQNAPKPAPDSASSGGDWFADNAPKAPSPPTATMQAQPEPTGIMDRAAKWAQNVSDDIKNGTDNTGVGTVLKKMGAHGVYAGEPHAVGDFMASLPLGLLQAGKGVAELQQPGKTWQGTKDVVGGAAQAATIPGSFVAPEAGEAGAEGIAKVGEQLNPGILKEQAGKLFADVARDANKLPVNLENAHDAALRLMDWQKKTQLGPTINKFLNRITSGNQGPLTYEEGRDFYQLLGRMSVDETSKLAPPIRYEVQRLTAGLKNDIGDAAAQVGRAADYYKAMGDYAHAARLQDWYDKAKDVGVNLLKIGAGAGLGGYLARKGIDLALDDKK